MFLIRHSIAPLINTSSFTTSNNVILGLSLHHFILSTWIKWLVLTGLLIALFCTWLGISINSPHLFIDRSHPIFNWLHLVFSLIHLNTLISGTLILPTCYFWRCLRVRFLAFLPTIYLFLPSLRMWLIRLRRFRGTSCGGIRRFIWWGGIRCVLLRLMVVWG